MHDECDYEADCLRDISVVRMIVEIAAVMTGAAGLILAIGFGILIAIGVL